MISTRTNYNCNEKITIYKIKYWRTSNLRYQVLARIARAPLFGIERQSTRHPQLKYLNQKQQKKEIKYLRN